MKSLFIASNQFYSGKSSIAIGLGLKFKSKGLKVGYMKPLGTIPERVDGVPTDADARFIAETLETGDDVANLAPVVLTPSLVHAQLQNPEADYATKISRAFDEISTGKDVVLVEGAGDLFQGCFLGLGAKRIADLTQAKTIMVIKPDSRPVVDDVCEGLEILGESLAGVIFNDVPKSQLAPMTELIEPYLRRMGVKVLGAIPRDKTLQAVTVRELCEHLGGQVLAAEERIDELVEAFLVGAMGQERALRYFRKKSNKAVITGGDRADVQLAALETSTRALILTGNYQPSPLVLGRAEELGIPVIMVDIDTLGAVQKVEELVGHLRVRHTAKLEKMQKLLDEHVDLGAIFALATG